MPKEINWNEIPKLNDEQRREMQSFVDKYGEIIEQITGKTIDQKFVTEQVGKNYDNYNKAQRLYQHNEVQRARMDACDFDASNYPQGYIRALTQYMTDDRKQNQALADSLSTKQGRQAFVNRVVKDLLSIDPSDLDHKDPSQAIDSAVKNCTLTELTYLSHNINDILQSNDGPKLEEPLKSTFAERFQLLESANANRDRAMLAGSPIGVLLSDPLPEQQAVQITTAINMRLDLDRANGTAEVGSSRDADSATMLLKQSLNETSAGMDTMRKNGWLSSLNHVADQSGKIMKKSDVLNALSNSKNPDETMKQYKTVPVTVKEQEKLSQQLESLPVEYTPTETENAILRYTREQRNRGNCCVLLEGDATKNHFYVFTKNRSGDGIEMKQMMFTGKEHTEPTTVITSPTEPKQPNLFKRFFHAINSNLFKDDFKAYADKLTAYQNYRAASETLNNPQKADQMKNRLTSMQNNHEEKKQRRAEQQEARRQKELQQQADISINSIKEEAAAPENENTMFSKFANSVGVGAMERLREVSLGTTPLAGKEGSVLRDMAAVSVMEMLRFERDHPDKGDGLSKNVKAAGNDPAKIDAILNGVMKNKGFQIEALPLSPEKVKVTLANRGTSIASKVSDTSKKEKSHNEPSEFQRRRDHARLQDKKERRQDQHINKEIPKLNGPN